MPNSHMPNESIGAKKPPKNGHVCPSHWAQISILQVDFLEILNNSRTRNENFDQFFDPEEPENNIFELIPEHQKIMVFLFIQSPQSPISPMFTSPERSVFQSPKIHHFWRSEA